jgi:hypothetical protein
MIFTNEERRLLILYDSGSVAETVDTLHVALHDAIDPDERAAVRRILRKIEDAGEGAAAILPESGAAYD